MSAGLFTIGYEGAPWSVFIAALKRAGVSLLVDVRDHPWSRRPEFCRKALQNGLAGEGVGYVHLKALGNPKEGRDAARDGDTATYHAVMAAQLGSTVGRDALAYVAGEAATTGVALMCMEKDPACCHRTLVAAALGSHHGLGVEHLRPDGQLALF